MDQGRDVGVRKRRSENIGPARQAEFRASSVPVEDARFAGLPPQGMGIALLIATIVWVIVGMHLMCVMGGKHCTIGDVPPALLVALLVVTIVPAGRRQLPPCSFIVLSGQCVILFWLIRSRATFPPFQHGL